MDPDFATLTLMQTFERLWQGKVGVIDFQAVGTTNNWYPGRYTFEVPENPEDIFAQILLKSEVTGETVGAVAEHVGTTGCGKSTSVILPTVARMHCSNPILSYAKERDAYLMAEYLKRKNYTVHILNAAHPKKSTLSYDPIASIESYADIEALSAAIVDMSIRKSVDDYWQVKAKQLLSGLIAGCFMTSKGSRMPGMADVLALFDKTIPCENAYGVEPELYGMFQRLEKASPGCFAVREFNSWRSLPWSTPQQSRSVPS